MMSNKEKFSIDDAFETDEDDVIKTYGTTSESTPLKMKLKPAEDVLVKIEGTSNHFNRTKSISKDSDSLIQNDIGNESFDVKWLWRHPKVKEHWRVMAAALGLLIIGIGLIVAGIAIWVLPDMGIKSFVFFIAGIICFIPGAYHVVYVYCAVKGKKGYDFYNLPLFN